MKKSRIEAFTDAIVASLQVVTWIIYSPLGSDKIEIDE